ncbi:hypothetical protein [Nonomuraea recticatena]|uniref:hypothetical protein n=1 Tax=Nonomuraea recticatena TaxID=46178 RepID=UPI0036231667
MVRFIATNSSIARSDSCDQCAGSAAAILSVTLTRNLSRLRIASALTRPCLSGKNW